MWPERMAPFVTLQCAGAEQSQRMMTERLAAAEEQLALSRHDALAAQLADAKLTLAQSEFHVLQLQVCLLHRHVSVFWSQVFALWL